MAKPLDDQGLNTLFREARSHNGWQDKSISDETLHALYDLLKMGPTSTNSCPARFIFVKSKEAKERLKPHLAPTNVEKAMTAPVVVIIGYDLEFYEKLPVLSPHNNAIAWFKGKDENKIRQAAFQNGTLQGAYLIMAARSLGLDCGPMGGINAETMKKEFFPDNKVEVNFICALGHGDPAKLYSRGARLDFDETCTIA